MAHKRLALLAVLLIGLVSLAPVSAQDSSSVTMIVTRDPVSLDPQTTLDPGAPVLLAYLYDTLVYQTPTGEVLPSLAQDWTVSDDNLTVTFTLKPGIVFSNGEPLNADAVIYTFERLQGVGQRSLIYDEISNIAAFEKIDDLTVAFQLAQPSATLLSALTYPYAGILNPSAVEAAGETYGQTPVGTGPFMLESWVAESEMTLIPNPNYGGHRPWTDATTPPSIDRLTVRFSTDEAARVNALLAGEADIAYLASGAQLERVGDGFTVLESPARALVYLGFNTARAPFDNPEVRLAVEQAINKDDILALAVDGMGEVLDSALPPTLFGYNADLANAGAAYDPAAAQARLASSGAVIDRPITILTSTFPTFEAIGVVLQAQLAALGITAEINVLDFSAVREVALAGDYDVLITRYDWNDPDVLWRYLGTDNLGDTNRYFYSNPALDELVMEGRRTFDPVERAALYTEAQQLILDNAPIIPLYMPETLVVVSDRLQNIDLLHSHVVLEDAVIAQP
jgi:peptide/nickel transport system substrate-binding protein